MQPRHELVPPGWKYSLVIASITKRVLETATEMPAGERLELLEKLSQLGGGVADAAIAHVRPACDTAVAMAAASGWNLDAFAERQVFAEFCRLNPSLAEALDLCGSHGAINAAA